MRCLTNFARRRAGRPPIAGVAELARSAGLKSADILRCDEFDHEACGRPFTYWIEQVGYLDGACRRTAENIAFGTGSLASPRAIFRAWIGSPGHRRNILGPYSELGVGLRIGALGGRDASHVWTQHFGGPC